MLGVRSVIVAFIADRATKTTYTPLSRIFQLHYKLQPLLRQFLPVQTVVMLLTHFPHLLHIHLLIFLTKISLLLSFLKQTLILPYHTYLHTSTSLPVSLLSSCLNFLNNHSLLEKDLSLPFHFHILSHPPPHLTEHALHVC